MFPRSSRQTIISVLCGVVLMMLLVVAVMFRGNPQGDAPAELPPIANSVFRNSNSSAAFVGMDRCETCHADAYATYLRTAHSQALATIDLASEPPDGEFEDHLSQRHYRIYRQGRELRHEESIRATSGGRLVLADMPVKYVIGSGRFSRSYLVERDGFLFESPVTWYTARSKWGLSPGYENYNSGFQRPAEVRCVACHAGRVEPLDHSPQRLTFHALSIDCERCHGPGALHAERWTDSGQHPEDSVDLDLTIVNPAKLNRERREDICAQCHFHSAATVELRGRSLADFRPGQRLADYVVHLGLKGQNKRMEVVGHMEQMRLSRCWQATDSLTCTTCHDPHAKPDAGDAAAHYRDKCLACHTETACGVPKAKRLTADASDNCIACHMPRSPTDIPHFAFTHHRIGIHSAEAVVNPDSLDELIPLSGGDLPAPDLKRNLGLGYLQLSDAPGQGEFAEDHRQRALDLLEAVHGAIPSDPEVHAALARLYWRIDPTRMRTHAQAVIDAPRASPDALSTACFTLGSTYYDEELPNKALPWLKRTAALRPTADVWIMLSDCLQHAGEGEAALDAARRAAELAPDRPQYVQAYARLLRQSGKDELADQLKGRFSELQRYRERVDRLRR